VILEPRPPVKERAVADHRLLLHERDAGLAHDFVEVLDGLEVAIDQRLVERVRHGTPDRLMQATAER